MVVIGREMEKSRERFGKKNSNFCGWVTCDKCKGRGKVLEKQFRLCYGRSIDKIMKNMAINYFET